MDIYTIDSSIPFNMIIDIEMGLLRLIRFEYRNNFFLYKSIENEEMAKLLLSERTNRNPLSVITRDDISQEELDELYKQFMEQRYDKILSLSPNTELFHLLQMSDNEAVRFTVVFDNKEQEKIFDLRKGNTFHRYFGNTFDEENIKMNKNLFIKDVHELSNCTNIIRGKNIYFADYGFNKTIVDDDIIINFQNNDYERFCENTFQFIEMYKIDEKMLNMNMEE